ncbi:PAS domain S-box protein [Thalassospira sp.]|uniref:PAS domain-containing protein n=1 Tax=Thalassospira sp. TaxID=1912094 RepID=UPI00311E9141
MNSIISIIRENIDVSDELIAAIDASFAVVEFDLDGTVLNVNESFMKLTGYEEDEVVGQHHSMFLPEEMLNGPDYEMCWADLRAGKRKQVEVPCITKSGDRIWVEETYAPVRNSDGELVKIVRFGVNVTERHEMVADLQGKVDAIRHSHAIVKFDANGIILNANRHFLAAMGYDLSEVVGQHHSMFVGEEYAKSSAYQAFWRSLANGETKIRQFKYFGKDGREVWFEATYSPVLDVYGEVIKIINLAVDITDEVSELIGLKSTLEVNFAEVDEHIEGVDRKCETAEQMFRQAQAHLEASNIASGVLVGCVGETLERMTELRSVSDHVFDTVIEGDVAAVALENAVDRLRDGAGENSELAEQIDNLDECVTESSRILTSLRLELKEMLNRMAVVSLAIEKHGDVTGQMTSEMHGIQTSLDAAQNAIATIGQSTEEMALTIGRSREVSVVLAR